MVMEINLLIVEDDDGQYETYSDTADEMLRSVDGAKFVLTRKTDFSSAKDVITSKGFDAAIVDLNLKASNATEASGNDVLKEIIGSLRFPVLVVSGNLNMLDEGIRAKESSFLRFYNRETSNEEIFGHIKKICSTGITRILGGRGMIETRLDSIFWNHLANDLEIWINKGTSVEKALLRYAVSHLAEYLELSTGENDYYEEVEFYIKPPIRKYISTGDIIEKDGTRYIVLSPPCDVAVRDITEDGTPVINASRITIAKLIEVNRSRFEEAGILKPTANNSDAKSRLDKIIKGQEDKYIFLPEYLPLNASVIDLQNLYAINFSQYTDYTRLATVASPFLKDIQSRFASYYARQGQPDLNKKSLLKKHKDNLNNVE
ncbi:MULTISPECIES: hypothetical protein [Methylomonas]|uniref:Response regulatory domain-containing protein n=2 Tax=Methylomonas TaxID=416 RepID=A0A126T4B9_9GAMM|nr:MULTISPECIES: hypothetical protein [Methylomonas]AMK76926.1 hypothetical protein JT25_010575 [Methylomonas denitrificans]OAH96733.1 hypothetical protein A1342_21835 [Methylomonas methanica]TCV73164.1 hypothetical protein EDE11_14410 [Methylomonas methanica]